MKQTVLLTLLFTDPIFDIFIVLLLKATPKSGRFGWPKCPGHMFYGPLLLPPMSWFSPDWPPYYTVQVCFCPQILWAGSGLAWNSIKFLLFSDQEVRSSVFPGQDNYHRPSLLSHWYDRVDVTVSSKCKTWLNGITSCVYPPERLTMTPIFCPVRGTGLYIPLYVSSWPTIESDIS